MSLFKRRKRSTTDCQYVIWVTKYNEGYSSWWYGWSTNLILSYEDAIKKAKEIKDDYYDVELIKYKDFIMNKK